jgi:hypothetical protein
MILFSVNPVPSVENIPKKPIFSVFHFSHCPRGQRAKQRKFSQALSVRHCDATDMKRNPVKKLFQNFTASGDNIKHRKKIMTR